MSADRADPGRARRGAARPLPFAGQADLEALRAWLRAAGAQLPEPVLARLLAALGAGERMSLDEAWTAWRHAGQEEPGGDWRVWLMMAGRGFGKTRAGAEWVSRMARETPGARIALVGATLEEVAKVMIDGQSGLAIGGVYSGPGRSPDRADACVWALTELMLGRAPAEPQVLSF